MSIYTHKMVDDGMVIILSDGRRVAAEEEAHVLHELKKKGEIPWGVYPAPRKKIFNLPPTIIGARMG